MHYEEVIKHVFAAKNKTKQQRKNAYLGTFSGRAAKNVSLSIAILNAPCNGFGDVVFAMKLYNYLTGRQVSVGGFGHECAKQLSPLLSARGGGEGARERGL